MTPPTHGNSCLASSRLSSNEDGSTSYLPLFDHLQDDPCCPPGRCLSHHALGYLPRLQGIVQSQTSDVGMSACNQLKWDISYTGSNPYNCCTVVIVNYIIELCKYCIPYPIWNSCICDLHTADLKLVSQSHVWCKYAIPIQCNTN